MLLDPDHPFFAKRWRRFAVVAVCLGWAGFEAWNGNGIWGGVFAAIGLFAAWVLLIGPWWAARSGK